MNRDDVLRAIDNIRGTYQHAINPKLSKQIAEITGVVTMEQRIEHREKTGEIVLGTCFTDAALVARYIHDYIDIEGIINESAYYCVGWGIAKVGGKWIVVEHAWVQVRTPEWQVVDCTWYTPDEDMTENIYVASTRVRGNKPLIGDNAVSILKSAMDLNKFVDWRRWHNSLSGHLWQAILND